MFETPFTFMAAMPTRRLRPALALTGCAVVFAGAGAVGCGSDPASRLEAVESSLEAPYESEGGRAEALCRPTADENVWDCGVVGAGPEFSRCRGTVKAYDGNLGSADKMNCRTIRQERKLRPRGP